MSVEYFKKLESESYVIVSSKKYRIRPLREEDIPKVMEMRKELKYYEVESILHTALQLDQKGISIVETEKGDIIGSCSAVRLSSDFCFVGMYYLQEQYRGLRLGLELWNATLSNVGHRNAALNTTSELLSIYRDRAGFSITETRFKVNINLKLGPIQNKLLSSKLPQDVQIHPFRDPMLPSILNYDRRLMGYERELCIALNCREEGSRTYVAISNGACVGFGSIKKSCLGSGQVGPLYADDSLVAEVLMKTLIDSLTSVNSFFMITVSDNVSNEILLKKLEFTKVAEYTRLYTREKMNVDTSKIFALMNGRFVPF